VLRIALAHDATLTAAMAATGLPSQQLSDAARFFVEQQILARECQDDPWRTLGVARGADIGQIRDHHRLLVRLVHPDRSDEWASAFADRVNKAWRQLRDESGRAQALTAVADTDVEFGQRRDVRAPHPKPVDAWAMRPSPVAPRPTFEQVNAMATPVAQQRSWPLPALMAVGAVVVAAIGVGFWLGVNQRTPAVAAATAIALDAPSMPDDVASIEAPPVTLSAQQSVLPDGDVEETLPIALTTMSPPAERTEPANPRAPPPVAQTAPPPLAAVSSAPKPLRSPLPPPRRSTSATPTVNAQAAVVVQAAVVESDPEPTIAASPSTVIVPAEPEIEAPTRAQAQALLDVYVRKYANGDLGGMLGLFAREVHAEDQRVAAIAQQYSRLFATTSDRVIALREMHWQRDGTRVFGSGQYQTRYRPKNKLRQEFMSGRIEFEVINDAGNARLLRLNTTADQRS